MADINYYIDKVTNDPIYSRIMKDNELIIVDIIKVIENTDRLSRKDYEYIITLLSVFEENLNEIINKSDLVYINIEIAPNYNNKENVILEIKEALKAAMDPTRLALMCKYMDDNDGDTDYYLWNMGFENIYQYISDLT